MTNTKQYTGWLLIDWRSDDMRFRKTKPSKSKRGPTEYPVKVSVDMEIPELDVPEISAALKVPAPQVKQTAYADLLGDDDADVPDWYDDVDAALTAHEDLLDSYESGDLPRESLVDTLVGSVIRRTDGYPDPVDVEEQVMTQIPA